MPRQSHCRYSTKPRSVQWNRAKMNVDRENELGRYGAHQNHARYPVFDIYIRSAVSQKSFNNLCVSFLCGDNKWCEFILPRKSCYIIQCCSYRISKCLTVLVERLFMSCGRASTSSSFTFSTSPASAARYNNFALLFWKNINTVMLAKCWNTRVG